MRMMTPIRFSSGAVFLGEGAAQRHNVLGSYPKCAIPNSATNEAGKFASNNLK
jgi:hypothetical protein